MALGKNLKKKKLIPEKEEQVVEQKPAAKKPVAKKAQPKAKKPAVKKAPSASRKTESKKTKAKPAPRKAVQSRKETKNTKTSTPSIKEVPVVQPSPVQERVAPTNPDLPIYIAQELIERKKQLRNRYDEELKKMKGMSHQFIVIKVGGEHYAVDIDVVKEVVPLKDISKTPNTPDHIKGIVNVRGDTYVVFDLAAKFKIIGDEVARFLLIIKSNELTASLMLSSLPATFKVNGKDISSSMKTMEDVLLDASYVKGLIHDGERLIYYLDIIELLKNDKAMIVPDKFLESLDD